MYSALWGGDLTSTSIGQHLRDVQPDGSVRRQHADYTALTVVKNCEGIHSGNRYIKTYPATAENAAWGDAYKAKFNEYPPTGRGECTAIMLMTEAPEGNSADGKKIAERDARLTSNRRSAPMAP